jgi:hypothetical protein
MNKDIRSLSSIFGGLPNYLQRTKDFSWTCIDKRGYKVSLYYTPTKPGVVEVYEPPLMDGY